MRSAMLTAVSDNPACSVPTRSAIFSSVNDALSRPSAVGVSAVAMIVYPSCFSVLKHDNVELNILKSSHLFALELDAFPTRLGLNAFSFSKIKYTFWIPNPSHVRRIAAALCGSWMSSRTTVMSFRRFETTDVIFLIAFVASTQYIVFVFYLKVI